MFGSVDETLVALASDGYLLERRGGVAVYLALALGKPLLVEGPAGVGKTELASALARVTRHQLIRLQCYEGLDEAKALYEWNYHKQLLFLQAHQGQGGEWAEIKGQLYSQEFLLPRPLLAALLAESPTILLVDEVDKADEEFEAFLLEALSEFQVSIPELGTVKAGQRPQVILTSNATRELGDALRRRCVYLYLDYPEPRLETEIIRNKLPGIGARLTGQIAEFVCQVRRQQLKKPPSIAETLDWAQSLAALGVMDLDAAVVADTLPVLLKYQEDLELAYRKVDLWVPNLPNCG